ncbi:AAA family ATPase [Alishewanella tabrizica]|uniref:AAA+ ATPase domain-containing protein n=1 Tax=Alishewanella tabrizica TaxID=671278 RepID=A0ABQ2WG40_9ALTE|nr:AAA family ATPase [Alishewanella tabrizica]GGW54553.1 hypothetical protein GCM10008111_08140 [Alishewanella tabrizica]
MKTIQDYFQDLHQKANQKVFTRFQLQLDGKKIPQDILASKPIFSPIYNLIIASVFFESKLFDASDMLLEFSYKPAEALGCEVLLHFDDEPEVEKFLNYRSVHLNQLEDNFLQYCYELFERDTSLFGQLTLSGNEPDLDIALRALRVFLLLFCSDKYRALGWGKTTYNKIEFEILGEPQLSVTGIRNDLVLFLSKPEQFSQCLSQISGSINQSLPFSPNGYSAGLSSWSKILEEEIDAYQLQERETFEPKSSDDVSLDFLFTDDDIEAEATSQPYVQHKRVHKVPPVIVFPNDNLFQTFLYHLAFAKIGRLFVAGEIQIDKLFEAKSEEMRWQDVVMATLFNAKLTEALAVLTKRTAATLIYPQAVYQLIEKLPNYIPVRTFDYPNYGGTVHYFALLNKFKSDVEASLLKLLRNTGFSTSVTTTPEMLQNLWRFFATQDDPLLQEFLALNPPGVLSEISNKNQRIAAFLKERVKGQSEALRQVMNADMWSHFKTRGGLRQIFTFLGPSGVGKTHLAKQYVNALSEIEGTGYRFITFNMENFSDERAQMSLVGSGIQFNDAATGSLTYFVSIHPRSVILFDEIEKAHPYVIQLLLTLLDSGVMMDETTRQQVDFSQCIVIFTSNLGHSIFEAAKDIGALDIFDVLRQAKQPGRETSALSPELVNRLASGVAVRFKPLNTHSMLSIAKQHVAALDADDDGIFDYQLRDDFAAMLLLTQLPSPVVRAIGSKCAQLLTEAKQKVFTSSLTSSELDALRELRLEVEPSCFARPVGGQLLAINLAQQELLSLKAGLYEYQVESVESLHEEQRKLQKKKVEAVFLNTAGLDEAAVNTQRRLIQRYYPESIFIVIDSTPEHNALAEDIWLALTPEQLLASINYIKLLLGVHWRLMAAKNKQQAFSYQLQLKEIAGSRVCFSITEPQFTSQISVARAVEGVQGLMLERPDVRLSDVVGLQRAKIQLTRVLQWLKEPERLSSQNVGFPAGLLLTGPPGTGKTMLAKALAGEADLPFISLSVSELLSQYVNGSAIKIDEAFKQASDIAPCILFIDEIDSIAMKRSEKESSQNNAVNALLMHLDGIQKRAEPIFVLAATNHIDFLDSAVVRSGRLDEIVYCDLPDRSAREAFFKHFAKKYQLTVMETSLSLYVDLTRGMSGADIDKLFRTYLYTLASSDEYLNAEFRTISDEVMRHVITETRYGAINQQQNLTDEGKLQTAWHEAGHLLASKILLPNHKIDFATIEPRNKALGFVAISRDDNLGAMTESEVRAQIAVCLAGREAERLQLSDYDVSAGAVSDIERATQLAYHAVCFYGLDTELGQINLKEISALTYSPKIHELAEERVRAWLGEGQQYAREILLKHQQRLQQLAELLYQKESLYADEIEAVFPQ